MKAKQLTPKFNIGDKVKEKSQPTSEGGKVLSFTYDSDVGFRYQFKTKEVNVAEKKIIHGTKTCLEEELEVVKDEKSKKTV